MGVEDIQSMDETDNGHRRILHNCDRGARERGREREREREITKMGK